MSLLSLLYVQYKHHHTGSLQEKKTPKFESKRTSFITSFLPFTFSYTQFFLAKLQRLLIAKDLHIPAVITANEDAVKLVNAQGKRFVTAQLEAAARNAFRVEDSDALLVTISDKEVASAVPADVQRPLQLALAKNEKNLAHGIEDLRAGSQLCKTMQT